jgi:hypothetical protein
MPLTGVPFSGESVEVTVRAAQVNGKVVRSGLALVDFWSPGTSTSQLPDYTMAAEWDDDARGFTVLVDTEGWQPGTWLYRGKITTVTDRGPAIGLTEFTPLPLRG